ncbi:MAG TPA: serine hydrolase [Flavisolibacter sp.]|jgi:CubicO group peptidase (beta-lactamase class C family)|nr:serine hydrolase [Flavisolibacter sp.]
MRKNKTINKVDKTFQTNDYVANLNRKTLLTSIVAFLCCTAVSAQDKLGEIDKIFSWVTPTTPGCVCAVSQNGNIVANRAYGSADLERNVPLTTNSVLDAGSVVKQFVAASVLLLVEDGRLSLTEDIRKYIPELPDYGHKITLDHLLTHTSGIRDWTGIRPLAEGDPDALTLTLRQRGLNFKPGDEWSYSNSGYVLLKEIVARTSGMSFSDFTRKRLFEPLKMTSTAYHFDLTNVIKNRALAYKKENDNWKLDVEVGNDRGGGGALLSTPSDLLLWNDALTNRRLGAFVTEKLHQPATLNNGRKLGYARGLMLDDFRRGGQLVWHSGGAAGYSTLLANLPEQKLSLAIMCNVDGGARSALGGRIFDLFLPTASKENASEATAPAANTAVDVKDKAGLFFHEKTGQPLRLVVNNNTLTIAGSGQLIALSSDKFKNRNSTMSFLSNAEFEMHFLSANQFEIRTKEGETIRYSRAKGFAPTANELNEFSGQYESNEMGSVLEIVPEKGGLLMRFYRNPAKVIKLSPVDADTFMLGMMTVRFLRDKNGKVVGYNYSNPVVRNIKFTRVK